MSKPPVIFSSNMLANGCLQQALGFSMFLVAIQPAMPAQAALQVFRGHALEGEHPAFEPHVVCVDVIDVFQTGGLVLLGSHHAFHRHAVVLPESLVGRGPVGHQHRVFRYESTNATICTKGITLETLVKTVLPKLAFPELDFNALMRPDGFREALDAEIAAAAKRRVMASKRKAREKADDARKAQAPKKSGGARR